MLDLFLAPSAVLLKFDFLGNQLLVLGRPIVDPLAGTAGEFYKSIL